MPILNMSIIQAEAHDISTLNTVVIRALHVVRALGNKYIVMTVDQALFPQLIELKWSVPEYRETLIPRLGGLHISMNFLKVLSQHMSDSGLQQIWEGSGLMGPNSTERVMDGKSYAKAIRAHKLTWQALWRLLLPQINSSLETKDRDTAHRLSEAAEAQDYDTLISILGSESYVQHFNSLVNSKNDDFIMAEWDWQESWRNNWHSQDAISAKSVGSFIQHAGLRCITNWEMFNVCIDDDLTPNESTSGRMTWDNQDENNILDILKGFNVFDTAQPYDQLVNIVTKDVATSEIQDSLLNAEVYGRVQVNNFVAKRFVERSEGLRAPIHKTKALTFASLYEKKKNAAQGKTEALKSDRQIFQRLITAFQAGRPVNLDRILTHELLKVP
ncbi:hypothetical protein GQR58_002712 [Nymphon striatum]|nr:hypothetical protein GQR58_002712 [Nymphon striatum]